jgi:1-acyl-sn-glycerol-3-phosphate acyltransferase
MAELAAHHQRIRLRGVNAPVYWLVRAVLQPLLQIYFRLGRHGRAHVPAAGPVILAANHRSFLDPFVIACCVRRPIYFVAKRELFENRVQGWILNALGAFPVRREESDAEALETARAILGRGDPVVIFPEGTRTRHGSLRRPRRGVGRLALETAAPVVPVAVTGSERARRGWLIRPVRVGVRCGRPLTFPHVAAPSQRLAVEVTSRIWPCVELQWEWLGGLPPLRRAAVVGAGRMGRALADLLAGAGLEVELGCRSEARSATLAAEADRGDGIATSPALNGGPGETGGSARPGRVTPKPVAAIDLSGVDLVVLALPSRALPAAVADLGDRITSRAGVLVLSKGLVAPLGATPTSYVRERVRARAVAWLGGPSHASELAAVGASVVVAAEDPDFSQQLAAVLREAGLDVERSADVVGAELAGCAKNVAALAAAAAAGAGMNTAGAAAAGVFVEVQGLARRRGGSSGTFAGLAGAGDLVATALAPGSRNRRAGELLGRGVPREQVTATLGGTAEGLDAAPLLADVLRREGAPSAAAGSLAALVEGRLSTEEWISAVRSGSRAAGRRAA